MSEYLLDVRVQFEKMKRLAEGALAQATTSSSASSIDAESNSLAVIVKHMAGNLRSRFTDFLTTDGEKPDRDRDGEFEIDGPVRPRRHDGRLGTRLAGAVRSRSTRCTPADLDREVTIRGERHTIIQALNRQLTHHAYHAGQIVFLAKHLRSRELEDAEHAAPPPCRDRMRPQTTAAPRRRQNSRLPARISRDMGSLAGVLRPQSWLCARGVRALPAGPGLGRPGDARALRDVDPASRRRRAGAAAGRAAPEVVAAVNLAQSIRRYGHLAAQLDPLGSQAARRPVAAAETHGLTEAGPAAPARRA